jgi:hypothetical protein
LVIGKSEKEWRHFYRSTEKKPEKEHPGLSSGRPHVLQGDNFVRISVGRVGEESVRIEKSKVARAVVKRLSLQS